jgi:hypothetical protein
VDAVRPPFEAATVDAEVLSIAVGVLAEWLEGYHHVYRETPEGDFDRQVKIVQHEDPQASPDTILVEVREQDDIGFQDGRFWRVTVSVEEVPRDQV